MDLLIHLAEDTGEKFKAAEMEDLLIAVPQENMEEPEEVIDSTFGNWEAHLGQVDDVCMIGICI